ncbi:MAG: cupin domain-containing protein [Phycisphaerales bacterium]|nr:cupin domain-containing protein [Phycisphaerales bacterium]
MPQNDVPTEIATMIQHLELQPHPEGGYYRETFRSEALLNSDRAAATSILFLLPRGVRSRWHRVDAEELWIYQAGAELDIRIAAEDETCHTHRLGLGNEAHAQLVVPANHWQDACSRGDWTLVACVVTPGFQFEGFQMAEEGWEPELK